jgi:hypothetical protein
MMEMQYRAQERQTQNAMGALKLDVSADGEQMIAAAISQGNATMADAVNRLEQGQSMLAQSLAQMASASVAPKQTRVIRDPQTNQIIGAEQV